MRNIIILILVLLAAIFATHIYRYNYPSKYDHDASATTTPDRYMDIETYVRTSISDLSPVKASLGGTFYVTSIESRNGAGTVEYEDGHNAYTADFNYTVDADGKPNITLFKIR